MMRIQIELPEDKVRELEQLMESMGVETKKELLNNALTLLTWAVSERRAGRTIASINERDESLRELVMPSLERAGNRSGAAA